MNIKTVRIVRLLSKILLVLGVLFLGIIGYSYIRIRPLDVKFSNVTSSSITVSWVTKGESEGLATVVGSNYVLPVSLRGMGESLSYDSRDVTLAELEAVEKTAENLSESDSFGVKFSDFVRDLGFIDSNKYYVHHVTLTNLEPESEYKIMIGDGLLFVNTDYSEESKTFKTLAVPNEISTPTPAYGSVFNADNREMTVEELIPVTDGVVYFNYLDEATGDRSEVFSSVLNDDGRWYIDLSNAKATDGQNFLEKYSNTVTNILAEVVVEAGSSGTWKRTINVLESAPVKDIVLNSPSSVQDESQPGFLKKIDNRSDSKGIIDSILGAVSAQEYGSFVGFCGPCANSVNGQWVDAPCNPTVLASRNCGSGSTQTAQEAISNMGTGGTCEGGGSEGDYALVSDRCAICGYGEGGTYLRWIYGQDLNKCGTVDGAITQGSQNAVSSCKGDSMGLACTTSSGETGVCTLGSGGVFCKPPAIQGDNDSDEIYISSSNPARFCMDQDNCICISLDENGNTQEGLATTVEDGEYCRYTGVSDNSEGPTEDSLEEKVFNVCEGKSVSSRCYHNSIWGECKISSVNLLDSYTLYCDTSTTDVPVPEPKPTEAVIEKQETIACWESFTGTLYRGIWGNREKCEDGKWVPAPISIEEDKTPCAIGRMCVNPFGRCINVDNEVLKCSWGNWKVDTSKNQKVAIDVVAITPGSECTGENGCICRSRYVEEGNHCPETHICTTISGGGSTTVYHDNGKVCNTEGQTCLDGSCNGPVTSSSTKENQIMGAQTQVFASEGSVTQYILDSQTGMIGGLVEGMYVFEHNGQTYAFEVSDQDLEVDNGNILVYIDTNENGEYNEGTDTKISDLASEINIVALQQKYDYSLEEGYNFVSIPFLISNTETRTAASLLKALNEVYGDPIYSISKFNGTWKVVGQNTVLYDNNDFQLIPGEGYVIKASRDIDISIVGQPVQLESSTDNAPILFNMGWNLMGTYGTNVKRYTAESLIDDINEYEEVDFTADNVSKWDSDVQMYEGLQKSYENGVPMVYGFDYPIEMQKAYFVKITQGTGNWQPEIGQ